MISGEESSGSARLVRARRLLETSAGRLFQTCRAIALRRSQHCVFKLDFDINFRLVRVPYQHEQAAVGADQRSNCDPVVEPPTGVEVLSGMKISTPPLLKMRSVVSEDGRWARFFLLFKTGQNAAFSLPFNTIGLYLKAVKNVIRTMSDRIAARGAFSNAEIADGPRGACLLSERISRGDRLRDADVGRGRQA